MILADLIRIKSSRSLLKRCLTAIIFLVASFNSLTLINIRISYIFLFSRNSLSCRFLIIIFSFLCLILIFCMILYVDSVILKESTVIIIWFQSISLSYNFVMSCFFISFILARIFKIVISDILINIFNIICSFLFY